MCAPVSTIPHIRVMFARSSRDFPVAARNTIETYIVHVKSQVIWRTIARTQRNTPTKDATDILSDVTIRPKPPGNPCGGGQLAIPVKPARKHQSTPVPITNLILALALHSWTLRRHSSRFQSVCTRLPVYLVPTWMLWTVLRQYSPSVCREPDLRCQFAVAVLNQAFPGPCRLKPAVLPPPTRADTYLIWYQRVI